MFEPLYRWMQFAGARGPRIVATVLIALVAIRGLRALSSRLVELAKTQTRVAQMREAQTRTMAGLAYGIGVTLVLAFALLEILNELGFAITPIAAVATLGGLSVGFGAQHLVKDLINGFFIVLEDQFVVGDLIRVNNETGRVEHITLRRTVIRNGDGARVTIPNGLIGQVANLSRDWSQTLVDVTIPSAEAVGRALAILEKVCGDFRIDPDWSPALIDGPRVLGIEALSLDGTILRMILKSAVLRQDDVARELRRRVKLALEQAHILVANTQRVELISGAAAAGG
ncbi:MAG TPA: mechanosensitive ion channel family protein [Candidatus Acidoferrales bacterium]|nr:mechanosensitive ion channel family protein [Candidatus Acidoferrales bacterium]